MNTAKMFTVMLVDDHEIMRDGLKEVLERSGDFQVIGQAADGAAAVKVAQRLRPDVIIMDVMMPIKNGIDACREITDTLPDTSVLILTASAEEDAVMEAVAAGAMGYLQKYSGRDDLLRAVRDVAEGEYRIPGDVIRRVFAGIHQADRQRRMYELSRLTERGAGYPHAVFAGADLRPDRAEQGESATYHPKRYLRYPRQARGLRQSRNWWSGPSKTDC